MGMTISFIIANLVLSVLVIAAIYGLAVRALLADRRDRVASVERIPSRTPERLAA